MSRLHHHRKPRAILGRRLRPEILLAVVAVAVLGAGCGSGRPNCKTPFDRSTWLTASPDVFRPGYKAVRVPLARRLIACGEVRGKTRRELRAMLGRPSIGAGNSEAWILGPQESATPTDPEYLDVTFGRNGMARAVDIG